MEPNHPGAPSVPADVRIKFGDRPGQDMPASWAEIMLRLMYARERARFGRLLSQVPDQLEGGQQ